MSTSRQQGNGGADVSPTLKYELSATQQGKHNDCLIRSDKKSVKKIQNYQDRYLKYVFTSTIFNDEPHPKCMLCFDVIDKDSMKPS